MADIFISYASKDRPAARRLTEALEACGRSVWWDDRDLRGGQHFDRIIEKEISSAKAVIVLWSQNSTRSDWVRAEAAQALDEKKLAPVRIDSTVLPLRFRNVHTIDLLSWTGETEIEPFVKLIGTLNHYLGTPNSSSRSEQPDPDTQAEHRASTAAPTFSENRKGAGKYVYSAAAIVVTGGVLWGAIVLSQGQPPPLPQPSIEATVEEAFERGVKYQEGRGVPQNDAEAVKWFRKAAAQGHASGQFKLGVKYQEGRGVPQDDAEAVQWYRKAAAQGNARAQNNLGVMYQEGRGVAQDDAGAVQWYYKAAEQGNADAQLNLGRMYEMGRGVAQDDAEAVHWYRKAAAQGNARAQFNLGVIYYEQGRGVSQDDAEAMRWFRKAAEQGHATAQAYLNLLSEEERL
jgi:TPR repeat protein